MSAGGWKGIIVMKAIVHVGWPKTGSSAVQDFLHINSKALAERGVRFERNEQRGSQFEYPAAVLGFEHFARTSEANRQRLQLRSQEEIDRAHGKHLRALVHYPERFDEPLAVFSSEHIIVWVRKPEAIRAFDEYFRSVFEEVRYLGYIRDPLDMIPSEISERAKRGEPIRTHKYVSQFIKDVDWGRRVRNWLDVVGKDRFDLRRLDRTHLHDGDLISDFCQALGVSKEGLKAPNFKNDALTLPGIMAMHELSSLVPPVDTKRGGPNPDLKALVRRVAKLTADGQKLRLNQKQMARVLEATGHWQEELRATFFPGDPHLFPPKKITERMNAKLAAQRAEEVVEQIKQEFKRPQTFGRFWKKLR